MRALAAALVLLVSGCPSRRAAPADAQPPRPADGGARAAPLDAAPPLPSLDAAPPPLDAAPAVPDAPDAPDAAATGTAPLGTSAADAAALCEEVLLEEERAKCAFRGPGWPLPAGGRVDVLEISVEDAADTRRAHLIIRARGQVVREELAEARSVPGEDRDYELGPLQVSGETIHLTVTETTRTYPDTGEPSSRRVLVERARKDVTCKLVDEQHECEVEQR